MTEGNEIDPTRLLVAAHELGHATVWNTAGIVVTSIWLRGRGRGTEGCVEIADDELDAEQWRGYLAGLLAGRIAGDHWADLHRLRFIPSCPRDILDFRRAIRRPIAQGLTVSEVRAEAHRRVRVEWPRVLRLAPLLASRGTVVL